MTNLKHILYAIRPLWCVSLFCFLLTSCFTGVESTPKIGNSELKHNNANNSTPEQLLLADVKPQQPGEWQEGKEFLITDGRVNMIFSPSSGITSLQEGDTIYYQKSEEITSPVGKATDIYFTSSRQAVPLIYRINASLDELEKRTEVEIPFTVEMSLPAEVRDKLVGKRFFIITPRWYDAKDNLVTRVKYVPVKILDVKPGNSDFPIKIIFEPEYKGLPDKDLYAFYMTIGTSARASRNFETLFSIKNPRDRYPSTTDEIWTDIIENRVRSGMTREEARLALGSPVDMDRGHDYSSIYERWIYDGGVYLIFRDGLLESFRK